MRFFVCVIDTMKSDAVKLKQLKLLWKRVLLAHHAIIDGDIVSVFISFEEIELREQLRNMRARWDAQSKVWFVPYRLIRGTLLESRITTP